MATENINELKAQLDYIKKLIRAEKDLAKQKELTAQAGSLERVIKNLSKYDDTLDEIRRKQEDIKDGANSFGQAIANLPLGSYMDFIPVTQDISKELAAVQENIDKVSRQINQDFAKQKLAIPKPNTKAFKSVISELEMKQAGLGKDLEQALMSGDIASFYKKYGDEGRKLAKEAMDKKKGFVGVAGYFGKDGQGPKDLKTFQDAYKKIEDEAQTFYKLTFNTGALLRGIRQNILQNFGFGKIVAQVRDFDNKLANLKKEFQIPASGFKGASEAMADLTIKGAKFGLSTAESFEMVKTIGEEMRSTNVKAISEIAQKVAAVPAAFGIASTEVSKITGQMMFFGMHTDKVESAFRKIGKQSAVFGQNATKVAKQFGEAYPKFKMMGMKGNESAIAAMAAQAEKLGINLADSVTSSKDFLDIGEAMEASADLSLLGGAAAQVSYADLMMARLDPKKMIEIQDKVTAGLGKFNKATGEVDFGYAELVQLQQLATRLGVKQEDLMKRAKGQREDAAKAAMFDKNMFAGLSPEEKTFLLSKVVSKGGGKFGVEGLDGIKDLKSVGRDQIKAMMQGAVNDKKKTEDLAKERASFDETVQRMQGTIMALFNRFQPILQMLTNVLGKVIDVAQRFSNAISNIFGATVGKYVKASLALGAILMLTFGPSAMMRFSGILFRGFTSPIKMLSGFGAKMAGAFKGAGGKAASSLADKAAGGMTDMGGKLKGGKTPPSFLQQFTKVSPAQILSVAAAMVALGIALMLIGKGIQLASNGLAGLVRAFNESKNAGMALAAVAVVMGGFVAMLYAMVGAVAALAAAGTAGAVGLLALGASLLMVGGGIYLAAKGMSILAGAVVMMGKNIGALFKGAVGLVALAGALVLISPALVIFGAASLIAVPGMFALGFLLKGLGAAKGVNPAILKSIAGAMGSMAWGLFKLALAAPAAPLAILSAMALNFVAIAINRLGTLDTKKATTFGNTLSTFASSVAKGMLKLGLVGFAAPFALLAAVSINLISKLLNGIKPIDEKNMAAFGKSLGSIGMRIAWGLTKLALIAIPAALALPGALMLNLISRTLNGIKPIDEKNMIAFGKSLSSIGLRVILGLYSLTAASIVGITALPGALIIGLISRILNGVKPVDEKNMLAFGNSLKNIGKNVVWGFAKLSVVGVLGVGALLGATTINLISRLLNGVKPVDEKNMAAFGASLKGIGGSLAWGFAKLSFIGVVGVGALLGATTINLISKLLNNVKPVDQKNIQAFGDSIGSINSKVVNSMLKLGLIAIPALFGAVAANRMVSISKSLNSIVPVNKEKLSAFAAAIGQISGKMVWGMIKLSLIAIPAVLANKASVYLISISKSLNSIVPVDSKKISSFASSLGMVSGKMVWGMTKLAIMVVPAVPALLAANRLYGISKALASILPVNVNRISQLSKGMSSVGGFALGKLGLLAIPARAASSTASSLLRISLSLAMIAPVNLKRIQGLTSAMNSVGKWALSNFAVLSIPAKAGVSTANSLLIISIRLSKIVPVNSKNIDTLNKAMSSLGKLALTTFAAMSGIAKKASSTAFSLLFLSKALNAIVPVDNSKITALNSALNVVSGIKKSIKAMSELAKMTQRAAFSAFQMVNISRFLSMVVKPNIPAMEAFGNSLGIISKKVIWGITKLGLIFGPLALANRSSAYILSISRNLSLVKKPDIPAMEAFGNSLSIISKKVIWGVTKLGLMVGPLALANRSASLLAKTSHYLSLVKQPNIPAMEAFGNALSIISGKVIWGVTKLGFIVGPLALANKSASLLASTSKNLSQVKEPNVPAISKFAEALTYISGKVMWGVTKLGFLAGPLFLANKSAYLMASVSRNLLQVQAPNIKPIQEFGNAMGEISSKMSSGVKKLARMALPLFVSLASAKLIIKLSNTLISAGDGITKMAQTINRIPSVRTTGLNSLKRALDQMGLGFTLKLGKFATVRTVSGPALEASMHLAKISLYLNAIKTVNPKNLIQLGSTLSSVSSKIKKGLDVLAKLKDSATKGQFASAMLILISSNLSKIVKVSKAPVLSLATVLTYIGPKVKRGLTVLGTVAPLAPLGIITAVTLSKLGQLLNKIPIVSSVPLKRLSSALGSVGFGFAKNLMVFGAMALVAAPALVSAKLISSISKTLASIPIMSSKPLSSLNQLLSTISGGLIKGLRKLAGLANVGPLAKSAAVNLSIITKELAKAVGPNTKALMALGLALSSIVRAVPAIQRLSTMNAVSKLAAASAKQIVSISKSLKQIPEVSVKAINSLAYVMSSPLTKIRKGITTLGLIAPFMPNALKTSKGLSTIGKNLKEIPQVAFAGLVNLVRVLSVQMSKMISGLQQLAKASKSISGAIATSQGLAKIANSLRMIAQVPMAGLLSLTRALSTQMTKVVKGLSDLSKSSPYIPGSVLASQGLAKIGNFIRQIPQVASTGLGSLGKVLASQMPKVIDGVKLLSKSLPSIPASIVAAQGLLKISNSIRQIPQVFFLGLSSLGKVTSSQMPKVTNGLKLLSKAVQFVPASIVSAQGLVKVATAIKQIPQVFFLGLSSLGKVLSSQMNKVISGIKSLSKAAPFIPSSIFSAQGLVRVATAVKQIPQVFYLGLFSLGNVLASRMPIVLSGIKSLSKAAPFIPSSIFSAQGLVKVATAVKQIPQVFYLGLFSLGNVLASRMPIVLSGIKSLSKAAPFIPSSIFSAQGLVKVSTAIKQIPQIFYLGLFSLGNVLASRMPRVLIGIKLLSKALPFIPSSTVSAQGLVRIAGAVKQIPQVFYLGLFSLGNVLASRMPVVLRGIKMLSKALPFIPSSIASAQGLLKVATTIRQIPQVFYLGLFSLGNVLASRMPTVLNGIKLLNKANPFVGSSITASKGLSVVAKHIKSIPQVFYLGLFSLGRVLTSQMPILMPGLKNLGKAVSVIAQAIITAQGLVKIANAIKQVPQVFFLGLFSLGRVISSQMPRVVAGIKHLGKVAPLIPSSITTAQGLSKISNAIKLVPQVFFLGLFSLGRVLASQMPRVVNGIRMLSRIAPLVNNSIESSKALQKVATQVKKVPQVFFLGLFSLGRVLSSQMPRVISGIRMLVRVYPMLPLAIVSAKGLAKVSSAIKTIPQVFFLGLWSLGRVLMSQMPRVIVGLRMLIRTIPFIPSSIKAAKGLSVLSKILKTVVPVNVKVITDLADAVSLSANKFLWGIIKWSILSFFMGGAIRTIKNVTGIFASLNSIGNVNVPKILAVIPVLDKLAEPLLSFAKIGELGPRLVSASMSLRVLGESMNNASAGFLAFSRVPWNMISNAGKNISELVNSLNNVANKVSISPNLTSLARTFYVLASAMRTISAGFASTTKEMAEFNAQADRIKVNTTKAEIASKSNAAGVVGKKGPAAGVTAPVGVFTPASPAGEQRIKIAPIEINLKLNGIQLQKLIAEANFYRT